MKKGCTSNKQEMDTTKMFGRSALQVLSKQGGVNPDNTSSPAGGGRRSVLVFPGEPLPDDTAAQGDPTQNTKVTKEDFGRIPSTKLKK